MSSTESLNTEQLNELLKKNGLSVITDNSDSSDKVGNDDTAIAVDIDDSIKIDDLIAERDSLKTELEQIKQEQKLILSELKKTKEVNFTLARQTSVSDQVNKAPEDLINEMFK